MVVNRYAVFVLVLSIPLSAIAEQSAQTDAKLLSFVRHQVAVSMAELSDRIDECREKRSQSPVPTIQQDKLDIGKEMLAKSILYLSSRNMRHCVGAARLRAAYAIHNLATVLDRLGRATEIRAANQELLYPDLAELKNGATFFFLPANVKTYLNKNVGRKPFDPVKMMKINHIFHH